MTRKRSTPVFAVMAWWMCVISGAEAADHAAGHFRFGEARLEFHHAVAVVEEPSDVQGEIRTLVFLTSTPLQAEAVAAAFDANDEVRKQDPRDGYMRLCFTSEGAECGLFFSPEGFNSSGYGELTLDKRDGRRIAGRWVLGKAQDFLGDTYEFDLRFDAAITPAPGKSLPAGGGAPGRAYDAWLQALATSDFVALRRMQGEDGAWSFPEAAPTTAKETLKSLREEQPLQAHISRGRLHGNSATLWVEGVDRDGIRRRGRVLMQEAPQGWRYVESDLESVEE